MPENQLLFDKEIETYSVNYLHRITKYLRLSGYLVIFSTVINLVLLLSSSFPGIFPLREASFFSVLFTIIIFGLAIFYENQRKSGEAIFEEVSDELQWHIGYRSSIPNKVSEKKPELEIRIALRTFARTTDLPLIPGKFGPVLYIGINILISLLSGYLEYTMEPQIFIQ